MSVCPILLVISVGVLALVVAVAGWVIDDFKDL